MHCTVKNGPGEGRQTGPKFREETADIDPSARGIGGAGAHQAASSFGRLTPAGHFAPLGQLRENQRIARSKFPVVRSRPAAMRSRAAPALKTMVLTRARDSPRCAA